MQRVKFILKLNQFVFQYFCSIRLVAICPKLNGPPKTKDFNLQADKRFADGKSDDYAAFSKFFSDVSNSRSGSVTIPAGSYCPHGEEAIKIPSNTSVCAYGAHFHLPKVLPKALQKFISLRMRKAERTAQSRNITSGPEATDAIQFEKNGNNVWVDGNIFNGRKGAIHYEC